MLSALIASPTLELQLAEEMLYLSPGENLDEPTQDSVINGTATLYLPKARIIKSISVVLNGRIG